MGLTVVTLKPASIAPKIAIGNSGVFGKQMAITSFCFKLNSVCKRTAKAAELSRNSAYVYCRPVTPHT